MPKVYDQLYAEYHLRIGCHPDGDCAQRDITRTVAPEGPRVVKPTNGCDPDAVHALKRYSKAETRHA